MGLSSGENIWKLFLFINTELFGWNVPWMSGWWLFNARWAIFQLYHGVQVTKYESFVIDHNLQFGFNQDSERKKLIHFHSILHVICTMYVKTVSCGCDLKRKFRLCNISITHVIIEEMIAHLLPVYRATYKWTSGGILSTT
jgi:hypothetical protein